MKTLVSCLCLCLFSSYCFAGTYVDGQSENMKDIASIDTRVDSIQAATGSYATVTFVRQQTNSVKIVSTNLAAQSAANIYTPLTTYRAGTNTVRVLATNQAYQAANSRVVSATNDILNGSTFSGDLNVSTNWHLDSDSGTDSYVLGMLGIGTNDPAHALDVYGGVARVMSGRANNTILRLSNYSETSTRYSYLALRKSHTNEICADKTTVNGEWLGAINSYGMNTGNVERLGALIVFKQDGGAGSFIPGEIEFHTATASANITERMTIKSNGKVGIGTNTPATTLDVNGGATVRGNITGNGSTIISNVAQVVINDTNVMTELGTKIEDGQTLSTGLFGPNASNTTQYVTLSQLNNALVGNYEAWLTKTVVASTNGLTPTNHAYKAQTALPAAVAAFTNEATAVGQYLAVWLSTNTTFTAINDGTASVDIYAHENQAGTVAFKAEVYLYDTVRQALVEWGESGGSRTMASGTTPTLHSFSVPHPSLSTNNACWLAVRVKVTSLTPAASPDTIFTTGPGYPSRFSVGVPGSSVEVDPAWTAAKAGYVQTNETSAIKLEGPLTLKEQTAEPANPADGTCVIWFSNGTGAGNDGDLMIKRTIGGVVSTNTISLL